MSGRDIGIVVLVVLGVLILLPLLGGAGMMGGWGMMGPHMSGRYGGGWGGPGMMFFGGIFWLLILVGVVLVITSLIRREGRAGGPTTETPLDILKRRLASGEITREEYEALKRDVS